ncbi:AAA family ATPase [Arthrobacter sp. zg-Y238]|uniref:AAA family ATPase n=1 Tax=Arthrobacter sp. zg-Y238 TaxID=2964614 RepID=UPI002102967A|nr:AAA family ATPase [Arthrobacter sp. zg-Y238]MCQ1952097.1 AAA family ATPase [Arthrobacter sp. zg-Y238]
MTEIEVAHAYALFRQEKSLDPRELAEEPEIEIELSADDAELPLVITRISDVSGVNALVTGSVIEPHAGLTILFGENGTGKTGYSRIFKALAGSRTADAILGDVRADTKQQKSAKIEFSLGDDAQDFEWRGELGHPPFTRMSIFDSPAVNFHVDDDLEYVYTPVALALYKHVISGIKAVQGKIEAAVADLSGKNPSLLGRFPKSSTIYSLIETLGASTDLTDLRGRADDKPNQDDRIDAQRRAVAALEANTTASQITICQRNKAVLKQATNVVDSLSSFDLTGFNDALTQRADLRKDYEAFRVELFKAADLPSEPESTWESFVASGDAYRQHLQSLEVHDSERCLYCRQPLDQQAKRLVSKYGEFLADKISKDLAGIEETIIRLAAPIDAVDDGEVKSFLVQHGDNEDKPAFHTDVAALSVLLGAVRQRVEGQEPTSSQDIAALPQLGISLKSSLASISDELEHLLTQAANRQAALQAGKTTLNELIASVEISKAWSQIETQVNQAKESNKLGILNRALPGLTRSITELSKAASDQLVNQNFDTLFAEECKALRAPTLKLEFLGRQGKAQRRKVLHGKHKPSKVLSEGEQKVLAMADFLAEARLAGITAPVIFDDPVSSLDHRRINEVASRVAGLAEDNQVIVFTHDIFFATTLLSLFEKSKRCAYFQITDEEGKGKVTRATGPRWDTLTSLKANINNTIQAAKLAEGEARAALVREGYDWIRSWCEVFTETDLLQGVSQRYQPNIRMNSLSNIKAEALPDAITTVTRVFDDACRYISAHSQPLVTLGVSPTLSGLEEHWKELQDCRKSYKDADA